jgi:phosphoglycolate phosphatase-like HAD superfamily hydrolase
MTGVQTNTTKPLLLLWDIDGTLVARAATAHGMALETATSEAIGRPVKSVQQIDPGGRTDREIVRVLAEHAGVPAEQFAPLCDSVISRATEIYEAESEPDLTHCVLPGVPDVLAELAARDGIIMGLVTGNIRRVAELKLGAAGIAHHLEFDCGGYGSDHENRHVLPGLARHRTASLRSEPEHWPRERTVVIGDTTRDIACARADGCLVIGIATGPHTADQLREADHVAEAAVELVALIDALS